MLFNSYEFILLFLPIALIGYFALGKTKKSELANVWLVLISLFFYSYWNIKYLPLLILSIAVNYIVSGKIIAARQTKLNKRAKSYFLVGTLFNIGLLGFYKYTDFLLENLNYLGADFNLLHIVLPLGISFFTITQMVYLVDTYEGIVKKRNLIDYALFVSFFPHLLAGPILYHKSMVKQFEDETLRRVNWENMARGSSLFIIGLAKKVLIADSLAPYVGTSFGAPAELTFFEAWAAAICYMLQLFFDFSGYSDMAVGVAQMLNIKIPYNFNRPFHAYGIVDFWNRWHMSLTWAITNYLYTPMVMACKKITFAKSMIITFVAMFIAGVWHGAGWTFVIFGSLHGIGLVVNHIWKKKHLPMWKPLGHFLTLMLALVAFVFFRADSVADALTIIYAMFGGAPIVFPEKIAVFMNHYLGIIVPQLPHNWAAPKKFMLLATLMVIFLPSSQQIATTFRPRTRYAVALAVLMVVSLFSLTKVSEFLYFQF